MHLAAKHGHTEIARILLNKGVDIFRVDYKNRTFIHHAVYWGKESHLVMLIDFVHKTHGSKSVQKLMDREVHILFGDKDLSEIFYLDFLEIGSSGWFLAKCRNN